MKVVTLRDKDGNINQNKRQDNEYQERPSQAELEEDENAIEYRVGFNASAYGSEYIFARDIDEANDIAEELEDMDMEIDWDTVEVNEVEEL